MKNNTNDYIKNDSSKTTMSIYPFISYDNADTIKNRNIKR